MKNLKHDWMWSDRDYLDAFELYAKEIMSQSWAIDEVEAGVNPEILIDEIWNGYEDWAEKRYWDQLEIRLCE